MTLCNKKQNLNQIKPISYETDSEGRIKIGGIYISELIKQFGSPLYILCYETLKARAQAYRQAFEKFYEESLVVYASKALNCKALCQIVNQEGWGIDVVSAGELYTALEAGFPAEKIIFHGNNKSVEELNMAIDNGITIMLDNFFELGLIKNILSQKPQKPLKLMARVTPGIECHTHEYIKTGKLDSKFGFNLDEFDKLMSELKALKEQFPSVDVRGLHAHIGSQIFETIPHRDSTKVLLELYLKAKQNYGFEFPDLNVGGGLGIKYTIHDDPPEIESWVEIICKTVKEQCQELGLKLPRIMSEPGRSLVGPAGVTAYQVGNIKTIPGIRTYASIDGGMADNTRPIMYQAVYSAEIDGKTHSPNCNKVTIAGKYCESGDVLIRDIELPEINPGDTLVVYSTGAYNYSMASNYNRATKPAMVLVYEQKAHKIIERETLADLTRFDLIPEFLKKS
jgi:diaminopimelate decarboxylase